MRTLAEGLSFPEGPVVLPDGSIALVEIRAQCVTRIWPDGRRAKVADVPGGPNGAALGPDGKLWICNNGGFDWIERNGGVFPNGQAGNYAGGSIQRVDLDTGVVETVHTHAGEHRLRGPNDLVFDRDGGLWFTDLGKSRSRDLDYGGLYYAPADGSPVKEVVHPLLTANGVGLSPDGTRVYAAETQTGRLWGWTITGPGQLARAPFPARQGANLLYATQVWAAYDSLAVEAGGNICVATLFQGGISVISPDGGLVEFIPVPGDPMITNLCFGGPDMRTAYITASSKGLLIEMEWPRPGLKLNF
jgi:gluconolactonase